MAYRRGGSRRVSRGGTRSRGTRRVSRPAFRSARRVSSRSRSGGRQQTIKIVVQGERAPAAAGTYIQGGELVMPGAPVVRSRGPKF